MTTYNSKKLGKVTIPDSPVTRSIAGHEFSLEAGTRYVASRPIATRGRTVYPVSIKAAGNADPDVVVDGLSYDEANELINAFNNGRTSFEGRVW
jgi:hypothetical protein